MMGRRRRGPSAWRRSFLAALLASSWGLPSSAQGLSTGPTHERNWQLDWQAPDGCASAEALSSEVERLLGREPESLAGIERITARIRNTGEQRELTLVLEGAGQSSARVLVGPDCERLVEAGALAIALALDELPPRGPAPPHSAPRRAAPATPAPPVAAAEEELPASPPDAAPSEPNAGNRPNWHASVETALDYGSLPKLTPALSLGLRVHAQQLSLSAHAWLAQSQRQRVGPGQFVEFGLSLVGTRACFHLLRDEVGSLGLAGCGVFEIGRHTAEGLGLRGARTAQYWWLAPGAAVESTLGLTATTALSARLEATSPLTRRRALVDDSTPVEEPANVTARGYFGVRLRFE